MPGENRGVVLVYLVDDRPEDADREEGRRADADHVVPLLSLPCPWLTPHKRDLIQWTVRVQAKEADAAVEIEA